METREFGKTGLKTTLLGFGGFHLLEISAKDAAYLLNRYLDNGGNYIETAALYGDGESEIKVGKAVSRRREKFILATKTLARDAAGCARSLDQSLRNLDTDHIDLLIMHGVGTAPDDLQKILAPGGALEASMRAKQQGKIGFIGISMHGQGDVLIEAVNSYPFDAVMAVMNYYDRFNFPEIEEDLIPLAQKKGAAIILMKALADGFLYRSKELAFRYAASLPVSVIVAGMNTRDMLEENFKYFSSIKPLKKTEKENLYKNSAELGNYVCRLCDRCLPCPEGINIPQIFKYEGYYDRQMADGMVRDPAHYGMRERLRFWFGNQDIARQKYRNLGIKADKCNECGQCMPQCPYGIDIIEKLKIADYKLTGKKIF
ncbi:MAG: aldo/keto reductase [Actinomycetota bacterium]